MPRTSKYGRLPTSMKVWVDNNNNLAVDGETYGCVKSFCYMGDSIHGADLAVTTRIRNG